LLSTVGVAVDEVDRLHKKIRRKSDLQTVNRSTWDKSQQTVSSVTELVESHVDKFMVQQEDFIKDFSSRFNTFMQQELQSIVQSQGLVEEKKTVLESSKDEALQHVTSAKEEMDTVLEEIKDVREVVKSKVGEGLQQLSVTAKRISDEVLSELAGFHTQLHTSYSSLGRDFKGMFEELINHANEQRAEADRLRNELKAACETLAEANNAVSTRLDAALEEERQHAAEDRQSLLAQITNLVHQHGQAHDERLTEKVGAIKKDITSSTEKFQAAQTTYSTDMDVWMEKDLALEVEIRKSRETLKTKLKDDWIVSACKPRISKFILTQIGGQQLQRQGLGRDQLRP
jgi:kinesin family protein 11